VWEEALAWIRERVSPQRYETWFRRIRPLELEPERAHLEVPNPFFIDWFEQHDLPILREALERVLGSSPPIQWSVSPDYYSEDKAEDLTAPLDAPEILATGVPRPGPRPLLNPRYTFENFVVGPSNAFCHAAALAVAREPGRAYNPLFIYGSTGLGKTHLMQAIGHALLRSDPRTRVAYVYCERFMNEMIEAISEGNTAGFRERYRNLDVLLIDDIHFLGGRESTQEEFFHTFNTLHDARKQIVVTSDRPPKEIDNIELRLISRFQGGLVAKISPPDLETRLAILQRKAEVEQVQLPEDVALLIASRVTNNIRNLEGCLVKLAAFSRLLNADITLDLAQEVLKDTLEPAEPANPTIEEIQEATAQAFGVPAESLRGKRRTSQIATARQVAMYLCRRLTSHTYIEIGKAFGHRDHSTVIHACGKVARERIRDERLERIVRSLEQSLGRRGAGQPEN
jgi:chromosomal replication initiator protein